MSQKLPQLSSRFESGSTPVDDKKIRNRIKLSNFCPYTQNQKFENFIKDLLELNLPAEQTQDEIVNFVRLIETFYCDKVAHLTAKERHHEKLFRKQRGANALKLLDKSDLEKAFLDSIEQTKANIEKRRFT